jgi:hypothetical protein
MYYCKIINKINNIINKENIKIDFDNEYIPINSHRKVCYKT